MFKHKYDSTEQHFIACVVEGFAKPLLKSKHCSYVPAYIDKFPSQQHACKQSVSIKIGNDTSYYSACHSCISVLFTHLLVCTIYIITLCSLPVPCQFRICCYYYYKHYRPGLKPGRVIQVNWVTFCLGQVGLTRFIRYPGLTRILHCITCIDYGVWLW